MGGAKETPFQLEIIKSEESNHKNHHYKNVVILHGTLPHQVLDKYLIRLISFNARLLGVRM